MHLLSWLILLAGGSVSGVLAGLLGIGGGALLVPLLVASGYSPVQAVATSSLAIVATAASGSYQNWRMGFVRLKSILFLGFPALITAQYGAYLAGRVVPYVLLGTFALLQLSNVFLVELRQHVIQSNVESRDSQFKSTLLKGASILFTGSIAGFLAGFFGVGGGVVLIPLQIVLLGEPIKSAVRTSLGVILITAISATIKHASEGHILIVQGVLLGLGGLLGAQVGTRYLPRLADHLVKLMFRCFLGTLSIYMFFQAWQAYSNI